ncbi:MAG TPA: hypothetical protein VJ521_13035 [Acidobacteriota bacterium]|nr:hypothetical protein [Acidobacteriota bacterium]
MVDNHSDEVEKIEAIRNLPQELYPPEELVDRTVSALKQQNLIRSSFRRRASMAVTGIAACLALFVSGFWLASKPDNGITMSESTFIIFLLEGSSYKTAVDEKQEQLRIEEYRNWARNIRAEEIPLSGVKLDSKVSLLGQPPQASGIAGYFVIEAKSFEQAQSIALSCPHLRYGGQIEIRRIQPV